MEIDRKGEKKYWTESEKLSLLFQIIEKAGPIPYDDLQLPEGRTKKAVQVMIDKEKSKIRKAAAAGDGPMTPNNEDNAGGTPGSKKRKAADESTPRKKAKTGPKKRVKAEADDTVEEEPSVKQELGGEDAESSV